jgi:putative exosortase-associated protein (TIGR04073 family)
MRKKFSFLAAAAMTVALASGCAHMEQKLGRGLSNSGEIFRGGEFRRTVEQTAVFQSPDVGYTTGVIRGMNRTLARTGIGLYEIVTSPFPPYGPVFTDHFSPSPVYPDNYRPELLDDSVFATDTYFGFSGGDVMPFVSGSRFHIFDGP